MSIFSMKIICAKRPMQASSSTTQSYKNPRESPHFYMLQSFLK